MSARRELPKAGPEGLAARRGDQNAFYRLMLWDAGACRDTGEPELQRQFGDGPSICEIVRIAA